MRCEILLCTSNLEKEGNGWATLLTNSKSGLDLSCGGTNRSEPRNGNKSLRIFRGKKVSKGRITVSKQRYQIQPGTVVLYHKQKIAVLGTHGMCEKEAALLPAASGGIPAPISIMSYGTYA